MGLGADLRLDHGGHGEEPRAVGTEHLQERRVVELPGDPRPDLLGVEPRVERAPRTGVVAGQEHGGAVEGAREALSQRRGEAPGRRRSRRTRRAGG